MGKQEIDHKSEILSAARSVFAEYGFKKVTMDDIAGKLDMTRSALYYYFKNKEDVFIEVINHELGLYKNEMTACVDREDTPEKKLVALASNSISLRKKFINTYKLTFEDMLVHYELSAAIKSRVMELHIAAIARILHGDRHLAGRDDIESAAELLSMSLRGVVFGSRDRKDERLQRDLVRVCTIFYHGLRAMAVKN
ncbi:MAG TPA: helix-turn-helix domain-containing protein [Spirochaetota bacterium]|nr:helix-turn-helix domain-containing protein [Spirochaetota bacterium]